MRPCRVIAISFPNNSVQLNKGVFKCHLKNGKFYEFMLNHVTLWGCAALWHDQNSHTAWHEPWVGEQTRRAALWGRGPQNLEGGVFSLGCQGNDRWHRPAGDAGDLCAGSWLPKICDARFGNRRSRMRWEDLVGKLGLPHRRSLFSTMLLSRYLM